MMDENTNQAMDEITFQRTSDIQAQPTFLDLFFKPVFTTDLNSYEYKLDDISEFFDFPQNQNVVFDWEYNREVIQQLVYHKAMEKFFSTIEEIEQIAIRNKLGGSKFFNSRFKPYYKWVQHNHTKPNLALAKFLNDYVEDMLFQVFPVSKDEVFEKYGLSVVIGCHESVFEGLSELLKLAPEFSIDYALTSSDHPLMKNRIIMAISADDPNDGIDGFGVNTNSSPLIVNDVSHHFDKSENKEAPPEGIYVKQDWVLTTPVVCDLHFPNLRT